MAYNRTFNPDALPAHAQPDEAAQALGGLSLGQQKPLPQPGSDVNRLKRDPSPRSSRLNPAVHAAQQSYRPQPPPPNVQYQQHYQNQPPPPLQQQYNYQSYDQGPNYHTGPSPPPPSGYGQGPRPRPAPTNQRPPPQPSPHPPQPLAAPPGPDGDLYPLFRAANISGTGSLTTSELGSALVNADFTPFDPGTIRSLMRMFSTSPPSQPQGPTITFNEFQNLWKFLAAWRELFERFDIDRSGTISSSEFSDALVAFGYRLSQSFISLLYSTFNERAGDRRGSRTALQGMGFDLFVQACISLKRMTDVFKKYDDDMDGYVTVSFEEFLTEILKLRDP